MVKHYILYISQFLTLDITAMHQYPFYNDSNKFKANNFKLKSINI